MAGWKKVHVDSANTTHGTITATLSDDTTDINASNLTAELVVSDGSAGGQNELKTRTVTFGANAFNSTTIPSATLAFKTISVSTGTNPVAESATDTLTITDGNSITVTGDATADSIEIKVADGGIDTLQLAADAVNGSKIADNSINSEHYVDGSIDTAHIGDDQVTYAKIQNVATANRVLGSTTAGGVVTEVQVSGAMIAADAVDGSKIANDSINSEHYVDGSVDNVHLANSSVTFGSTAVSLGSSSTSIGGLTGLDFTAANASIAASIGANTLTLGGATSTVVIAGDLTVSGDTTTINTSELTVEDSLVRLANVGTPTTTTANGAGIEVLTDEATYYPSIKWNKDGNGAGWELWQNGTSATDGAIAVMKTNAAVPSGVPTYGDGTLQLYTGGAESELYVYLA